MVQRTLGIVQLLFWLQLIVVNHAKPKLSFALRAAEIGEVIDTSGVLGNVRHQVFTVRIHISMQRERDLFEIVLALHAARTGSRGLNGGQ